MHEVGAMRSAANPQKFRAGRCKLTISTKVLGRENLLEKRQFATPSGRVIEWNHEAGGNEGDRAIIKPSAEK